jgi:hypothetical protein
MLQSDVEQLLIQSVCKIQDLSGRVQVPVHPETRPILDVPEFDSLNGVELTVDVVDQLRVELDFNNALVDNGRALSIAEAAARLLRCTPKS